jgi:methylornithine synthase
MGMEPASQDEFNRIIEKQQGTPIKIPVAAV